MIDSLDHSSPQGLYDTQVYTNNLLAGAAGCRDYQTLDQLAEIYLKAYPYLKPTRSYSVSMGDGNSERIIFSSPVQTWREGGSDGQEAILDSSQFLYLLAYAIDLFTGIPENQRTPNMKDLIQKFSPVVLNDHYQRWLFGNGIFSQYGWGCTPFGRFNHSAVMGKLLNREFAPKTGVPTSYCNAVNDWDMWIMAGVVEMLSANQKDPARVTISPSLKNQLLQYVGMGSRLLASRLQESRLTDLQGHPVTALNFDLGVWDTHPENAYSGYTGQTFPKGSDQRPARHVGWDIGHSGRFVYVFETLYSHRDVTGQSFPDLHTMQALTNQLVYGTFSRDFRKPLFTNYLDGTNGWYKVSPDGGGYASFDLSIALIEGPWCFWSKYNPDLRKIQDALWAMIRSTNPEVVRHRESHYGRYYDNYKRTASLTFSLSDSYELLEFLPTFLPFGPQSVGSTTPATSPTPKAHKSK